MRNEINRPPMAVILAAGVGSRLSPLSDKCPKSLLSVGGSVVLERMIRNCLSCGMSQFVLVLGHRAEDIKQFVDKTFRGIRVTYVMNDRYRDTNTGYSLMLASAAVGTSEFVKLDADVVFDVKILRQLLDTDLPNLLCVDRKNAVGADDIKVIVDEEMKVLEVGKSGDAKLALGRSIGIEKISAKTGPLLFKELAVMMDDYAHLQDPAETAYARLVENGTVFRTLDITGMNWVEIDTAEDFAAANAAFGTPVTTVSRGQQRAIDEAKEKVVTPT